MRAMADPITDLDYDPPGDGAVIFRDREDGGRRLAEQLTWYRGTNPVVLGLALGGVPVAAAVAQALAGELDVLVVRKLGGLIPMNWQSGPSLRTVSG